MPSSYTICLEEEWRLNSILTTLEMKQKNHFVIRQTNQHEKRLYKQQLIQHLLKLIQPKNKHKWMQKLKHGHHYSGGYKTRIQ